MENHAYGEERSFRIDGTRCKVESHPRKYRYYLVSSDLFHHRTRDSPEDGYHIPFGSQADRCAESDFGNMELHRAQGFLQYHRMSISLHNMSNTTHLSVGRDLWTLSYLGISMECSAKITVLGKALVASAVFGGTPHSAFPLFQHQQRQELQTVD